MTLHDKLRKARESIGKNQKEMAEAIGSGHRSWQAYEQGNQFPGGKVFEALARLGFNTNWFFSDDPNVPMMAAVKPPAMFIREDTDDTVFVRKHDTAGHIGHPAIMIPDVGEYDQSWFDLVPMAEAHLSAGGGAFVLSEKMGEMYSFRKDWLRMVATSPKNVVLMNVKGDSMMPAIKNGDTVLIDIGRRHVYDGNIYALRLDETIVIKRLSLLPGNRIMILSDNKAEYPPYDAEAKDIHVIGQVVWLARALTPLDQQ